MQGKVRHIFILVPISTCILVSLTWIIKVRGTALKSRNLQFNDGTMETNNTSFKLKRDNGMENAAVADIFSLFAEKWEDTSKKSAREVMSLILGKMKDTCLSTEEGDLEEHLKLLHANQYFAKIISHFQSNEPLLFAISGNTFEASMKNLRNCFEIK